MRSIEERLGSSDPDPQRIQQFLRENSFPLVEGRDVTFVYHGPADQVLLRHMIFALAASQPFRRLGSTDLWSLTLQLPERSRVEYKIERVVGGRREWLMDPLNPRVARDPFGANSVCHGAGYETPEWTLPDDEARPGALDEVTVQSRALGEARAVRIYVPARFRRGRRYPLLVVHDGHDYLRYAALKVVLDNLIHRLEIPPLVAALTIPGERLVEYAASMAHASFLSDELLPVMESRFPLVGRPDARVLIGASMGGVAALFTAWKHPGLYGGLLLQSGSFVFTEIGEQPGGTAFEPVVRWVNEFRDRPGQPAEKVFMSCGVYEPLIYENRSLLPLLRATGMDVRWAEARDGHNWENWRDRLREGLSWLLPGPLWMVYE